MKLLSTEKDNHSAGGKPRRLTDKELSDRWHQVSGGWKLIGEEQLKREYKFPDFKTALQFTNHVGAAAESINHHPDIYLTYGAVRLEISTHSVGGLTEADFQLAEKVNEYNFTTPANPEIWNL